MNPLLRISSLSAVALAVLSFTSAPVMAEEEEADEKSYADLIENLTMQEGLFNFYRDPETGEMLLSITEEQLDKQFIYFSQTVDGVLEAGHFRGNYRDTKLIEFRRYFDRIDIISKTNRFQFDEDNALHRASDANISEAVLASVKIKHEEDGRLLLPADDIFLSEALHKISPWSVGGRGNGPSFSLGQLNKDRSRILQDRVYPNNMDVVVDYVFNNPDPQVFGSSAITDPRAISIKLQHSFIEMPQNDFQPRRDDARVGYFGQQFDNMTSADWAPWGDVINRWNLVKKDPDAELSEPVEPIVWWIENTTPEAWRDTVARGVLAWNEAFEAAGFKDAIEVRVQPDDAEWDAGDINYNVVRWTSSPRPPFGGYGPSLANPVSGEIIAADIMMEFVFMSNRWFEHEIYGEESYTQDADLYCSLGHKIHADMIAGQAMSDLSGAEFDDNKILRQGLEHVILHEVGHTLGLNHNMKASILWDNDDVHNEEVTQGVLTGSVMDYAPINVAPPGKQQGDYYQWRIGPYDAWAIEYGYSPSLDDPEAEEQRLNDILSRSHEHELAFGNDADDMRAPGRHIDPRIMTGDMSENPVTYATERFDLVNHTFGKILDRARVPGESHQQLMSSAYRLFGAYRGQANVITRHIGGVYIERAVVGQADDVAPYTPVPRERQKQAMEALTSGVFAPDVLEAMQPTLAYLQQQRRGFSHYGDNEDPKFHDMVLGMQRGVLDHVMHENVLKRMTDTALYGNEYPLSEMMNDLTSAIFPSDQSFTTLSKNLQIEYVERLINMSGLEGGSSYDNLSKTQAVAQLNKIKNMRAPRRSNIDMVNHFDYLKMLIERAQSA